MKRVDHAIWKIKDRKEEPLALLKRSTEGRVPRLVELKNEAHGDLALWILPRRLCR